MDHNWENQHELPVNHIHQMSAVLTDMSNTIHYNSQATLIANAQKESKLKHFIETSCHNDINEYLQLVKNRQSRSTIAKIRTGVLDLAIEVGRRKNIPVESRICTQCNNNQVEDELHFMFICSAYSPERHHFNNTCSSHINDFNMMSATDKYISIMNCSNQELLNQFGKYLSNIHQIRKNVNIISQ